MATSHRFTPKKRERFLALLGEGYTVAAAARDIGLSRRALYQHREDDPAFVAEWDAAIDEGSEYLEQEARRRAIEGTERGVYHQGQRVGTIRQYSDTLLIFLLKGRKPDVYRENATVKHEGQIGIDDGSLSDDRRGELVAAILDAARARVAGSPADDSAGLVPPAGSADAGVPE